MVEVITNLSLFWENILDKALKIPKVYEICYKITSQLIELITNVKALNF